MGANSESGSISRSAKTRELPANQTYTIEVRESGYRRWRRAILLRPDATEDIVAELDSERGSSSRDDEEAEEPRDEPDGPRAEAQGSAAEAEEQGGGDDAAPEPEEEEEEEGDRYELLLE